MVLADALNTSGSTRKARRVLAEAAAHANDDEKAELARLEAAWKGRGRGPH
jgi:hypothetical protein